jgi:hypothetical protein
LTDFLTGDAYQLSQVLEAEAKKDSERFARLALRFPEGTHLYYLQAVLRAVADIGVGTETLLELCRKCHGLPGRPCGSMLCNAVGRAAERDLPAELLDMVCWYATEDPDPEREVWLEEAGNGSYSYGGEPFSAGINSTRGRAALAIADLIAPREARVEIFLPTLERLVDDPSVAVRSCAARALLTTMIHDRDLAVGLFVRLCEGADDALLGTEFVERFLRYATATHFLELEPVLERMLASADHAAVAVGARQSCFAALDVEAAKPLAEGCLKGDEARRAAAAEVFAANLGTARYRSVCEEGLVDLFGDDAEEVRRTAARCFSRLRDKELGEYRDLVRAFADSRAFDTEHGQLLYALQRTTARMPDESCLACERFLEVVGEDAANIQLRAAADAATALEILVRSYNQSREPALQARCLDLFDRMTEIRAYQVIGTLERYER